MHHFGGKLSMFALVRFVFYIISIAIIISALVGLSGYVAIQGSLPKLEGSFSHNALESGVRIDRDINGLVTISSNSRNDSAFALGFVHAQERFFQMDLLRRYAAGELSELFGETSLNHDQQTRLLRFRSLAKDVLMNLTELERDILNNYTLGVNRGLSDLRVRPFEYIILRKAPIAWQPEDSVLVLYSTFLKLQNNEGSRERSLSIMKTQLSTDWYEFLTPKGGNWDSPISGNKFATPDNVPANSWPFEINEQSSIKPPEHQTQSSNSWAIGGSKSKTEAAIIANDIHLEIGVPNTWFRASWKVKDRWVAGATLPGMPSVIVGTNEHIAWGLTNSFGDWSDLVILETNPSNMIYQTPEGWENFKVFDETIRVSDQAPVKISVKYSRWGPVIGKDNSERLIALKWVALDPLGTNFQFLNFEKANNVDQALTIASSAGVPHQNFVVADKQGNIGWTIMGKIPNRIGFDGSQPESWANGNKYWKGYIPKNQYPSIRKNNEGILWTANNRTVFGSDLSKIGDGGYALGARATQINDKLISGDTFNESQLLEIQLDNRAIFLERWHSLLLAILNENTDHPLNREAIELLQNWQSRSDKESAAYLIVKEFRENVINGTIGQIYQRLEDSNPGFKTTTISQRVEYPTWQLISKRPEHLIPGGYNSWGEFFQKTANQTLLEITKNQTLKLSDQTWGNHNQLIAKHPLSKLLPGFENLMDMPITMLNGDDYMPHVQSKSFGASLRMVVSPGQENTGIFHMPTSQSGHPLSPYYRNGHQDWVEGKPSSFLPGSSEWNLTFWPEKN